MAAATKVEVGSTTPSRAATDLVFHVMPTLSYSQCSATTIATLAAHCLSV